MSRSQLRVLMVTPELPSPERPGSMAPTARQIDSLRALDVQTTTIQMQGIPKLKYLQAIPRVRAAAAKADLVHAHFGYCGWLARMQFRAPLVVSFMGDDLLGTPDKDGRVSWFSKMVSRANQRLAKRADAVIVKSQEMADLLAPTAATVIPNGVDMSVFCPSDKEAARRELGLPLEAPLVLFPGNPENPRKGFALAQGAMDYANERLPKPAEVVTLWGRRPDQVAQYMNACDAMFMTSFIEGSPNVVKEAMACNLPVVGVQVGDVEQLIGGLNGYSISPRDPSRLGQRLFECLNQPPQVDSRDAMPARGLDLHSAAKRVVEVYHRVLESRATQTQSPDQAALAGSEPAANPKPLIESVEQTN